MVEVGGAAEEYGGAPRSARGSGWRDAFLNRHRRPDTTDDILGGSDSLGRSDRSGTAGGGRARNLSRGVRSRAAEGGGGGSAPAGSAIDKVLSESFDQQAVLDQDRALIEQLTQRQQQRSAAGPRPALRKPPPPPKVTPYRARADGAPSTPRGSQIGGASAPTTPQGGASVSPIEAATAALIMSPQKDLTSLGSMAAVDTMLTKSTSMSSTAATTPSGTAGPGGLAPSLAADKTEVAMVSPVTASIPPSIATAEPIVPRTGHLFSANDIDSIMDRLDGGSGQTKDAQEPARGAVQPMPAPAPKASQCTQNFGDISQDFFRNHGMEVLPKAAEVEAKGDARLKESPAANALDKLGDDFVVPQRTALKQQIQAIDSWLEDDVAVREQLSKPGGSEASRATGGLSSRTPFGPTTADPSANARELAAAFGGANGAGDEAEVFRKLEDLKSKKASGEKVSPVLLKNIAAQAKPLFPGLSLEKLVHILRLFTSARVEDHDLYLRILGEIPMQIRGITPEQLTTCVRVLWRLRLHEATYLELFSMEAMNMIRAKRRSAPRAPPRRAPVPRSVATDAPITAAVSSGALPTPTPPCKEAPAPFSPKQLVQIGNALCQLGSKPPARFLEIYQEQLALAIARLSQVECEMVCPAFAMSQLMPDTLRRAFLERCAQVDAGGDISVARQGAAPDIVQHRHEEESRRRRLKHFRNMYVIEASVRKETFSFFSSLSVEVRGYLENLHTGSAKLAHEGQSELARQVAFVLDQLGVQCDLTRMAGPLSCHVVAKSANPRADVKEIVYECSDASAFYAVRLDDKGAAPEMTAEARLRHKLLQRLGVQLTHISVWEWQQMSEAQRINYMVKLQSLQ